MNNLNFLALRFAALLASAFLTASVAQAQSSPAVTYESSNTATIQGTEPFSQSYTLTVGSPGTLPRNTTVVVQLQFSVLSAPKGVSNTVALGFISASGPLTFTAPGQAQTTTITLNFPTGNFAGSYSYKISTILGTVNPWPEAGVTDIGSTVNATVSPAITSPPQNQPSVSIQSPANGSSYFFNAVTQAPVTIPITIQASVNNTDPVITALAGSITGGTLSGPVLLDNLLSILGLNGILTTGNYTFQTSTPGTYTVNASATNSIGTSTTSSQFTVSLTAPPPTIAVSSPALNASYAYTLGSSAGATVPVSVTGTSLYGNIATLTGTLDGAAISLTTTGVGTALVAAGSSSLIVPAGTHSLVFTTTSAWGTAATTVPFTVVGSQPPPTITITSPVNNSSYSFAAGGSVSVPYAFTGATPGGTITSVVATLNGPSTTIAPTVTGLGTANISGTGTLTLSAAGTYTITATDGNAGGTASASTTFTVTQSQPQILGALYWLPPLSCNNNVCGGSTVPIAFTILTKGTGFCSPGTFVEDVTAVIAVSEIYSNGTSSTPVLCTYSAGSDNYPNFSIKGSGNNAYYVMNFSTATGTHHYSVEVYQPLAGGTVQILSQIDIYTQGNCSNNWNNGGSSCSGWGKYGGDQGCGSGNWGCNSSGDYCYYGNFSSDTSYGGSTGNLSGWGCNGCGGWGW